MVQNMTAASVLLGVALRDAEARGDPNRARLFGELARHARVSPIGLVGLGRAEIGELARRMSGGDVGEAAIDHLVEQTGGNPFYLSQLIPLLEARGKDEPCAFGPSSAGALPRRIRDAILGHLAALPEQTVRALEVAAVIGRDVETAILALVLGVSRHVLLETLRAAIDCSLLLPRDESYEFLRFAHVLIRDALYTGLTTLERARLHRAVGDAIAQTSRGNLESVASNLAYHFARGDVVAKAIEYTTLAGRIALDQLAYEDASGHFEAAVALLDGASEPEPNRLCELLLSLGTSQTRSGDLEAARRSFRRAANLAREIRAPERLAQVALDLAPGFFSIETGIFDAYLVERLEEALDALGDGDPVLRARLLGRLAIALYWTPEKERRERLCTEAAALAEDSCSVEAKLNATVARHAALWCPENLEERLRDSEELTRLSENLRNRDALLVSRCFRVTDLLEAGEIDAVRDEVGRFRKLAEGARQPECLWMAEMYDTMLAMLRGQFERVEAFALHSMELGRKLGHHNAYETGGAYMTLARCEVGGVDEFLPVLESYAEVYPAVPGWYSFVAIACMRSGNMDRARAALSTALRKVMPADTIWMASTVWLSEVAGALEAAAEASQLYEQLLPFAGRHAVAGYGIASFGSVHRYLGLLSSARRDWECAVTHLQSALEENSRLEAASLVAHTERELAKSLWHRDRRNDRERAVHLVASARASAARLGMRWLGEQASRPL
jgi:tetratricopeptide (TPR) repeat protein